MKNAIALFIFFCSTILFAEDTVTIAILAKDKAHCLTIYLQCIEEQTWPKEKTYLYIRTNNNNDNTKELLRAFVDEVQGKYLGVYFDDTDVPQKVQRFGQHEWNKERFDVLAEIRQKSIDWARENDSHYFVVDCDNFIFPHTLEALLDTGLPVVAPLLHTKSLYSNFHADIDQNGYYKSSPFYDKILFQEIKGLIEMPVVHCTYFIRKDMLQEISYRDQTSRMEYVIFSHHLRKKGIPQYLDNRSVYGHITFATNEKELLEEPWLGKFDSAYFRERAFSTIYNQRLWGGDKKDHYSGPGSTEVNTVMYRGFLQQFMKEQGIKTVVDVGCGDWQISSLLNWEGITYTGYDIVGPLIEKNRELFGTDSIEFICADMISEELPEADLLICKDVLQHLPNKDIHQFIKQFPKFKHCIITNGINYPLHIPLNQDVEPGGFRPLDLTKPPFNLTPETSLQYTMQNLEEKKILHFASS